jgi:hypothetical protein
MSDDEQTTQPPHPSELEREERRLEKLRLLPQPWPVPRVFSSEPDPEEAA